MSALTFVIDGEPHSLTLERMPMSYSTDVWLTLKTGPGFDAEAPSTGDIARRLGLTITSRGNGSIALRGAEFGFVAFALMHPDVGLPVYEALAAIRDQRAVAWALDKHGSDIVNIVAKVAAQTIPLKVQAALAESVREQVNDGVTLRLAKLLNESPPVQRVEVVGMPDRLVTTEIKHDQSGRIVKTTQTESDRPDAQG